MKKSLARRHEMVQAPGMLLDYDDLLAVLRESCSSAGSITAWAKRHGFAHSYVAAVLRGERKISGRLAWEAGYQQVMRYKPRRIK